MSKLNASAVADASRYADRWLAFQQAHLGLPGVQAAVWFGDGIVLSTAHGVADLERGEELTPDHRFRVASHSKTFTAAAILRCVERGELRLDDTVGRRIDELRSSPLSDLTLRELLAHAGGVIRDGSDATFWALGRAFPTSADLLDDAASNGAVLEANERFKYSNVGYSLLGLVLERSTGMAFAELMEREFIEPLGLRSTTPDLDTSNTDRNELVTGYTAPIGGGIDRRLPIDHVATNDMIAATGFVSNASDLVRWFAAHFLGDEQILTDRSKRLMQQPVLDVDASGSMRYGLGLSVDQVGGRTMRGHGGGFPGHLSRTMFDPVEQLAVSTMTNGADGAPGAMTSAIVRLVDAAAKATPDPAAEGLDLTRYEGRFAGLWGVIDVVALGGRLHLLDPRAPDPLTMPTTLDLVDDSTVRLADTIGYGSPGEPITFHWRDDGSISRLGRNGEDLLPIDDYRQLLSSLDRWPPSPINTD